jgi:hypothetical protein
LIEESGWVNKVLFLTFRIPDSLALLYHKDNSTKGNPASFEGQKALLRVW